MDKIKNKKALIFGVTGQDGSYLAEFLLSLGYEVHGVIRRASTFNTSRIDHIVVDEQHTPGAKFLFYHGDVTDATSVVSLVQKIQPDEIYNLAAQSHVKVSFESPEYTANADALGTLRILEAIRLLGLEKKTKFYQASTSELFGKASETPQNENTPFYPRSPYGAAKLYAYWITKNYREAYNIFGVNGVLFNHECISENTPVIIRNRSNNIISIKRIKDIRKPREKGKNIQQWILEGTEIWNGKNFVDLKLLTATRRNKKNNDFSCKTINTRHGVVEATNHHTMILADQLKTKARDVKVGQRLLHGEFPRGKEISSLSCEEALFMGMITGDGYISEKGRAQFSNNEEKLLALVQNLWRQIALGHSSMKSYKTEYGRITQIHLNGNSRYLELLKHELYTQDGFKKVPDRILNASCEIKMAFLEGYNMTDGLKSNPCTYQYKNFKTDSILLAQGLLFLISQTTSQNFNITFESDEKNYGYYSINLLSSVNQLEKEEMVRELVLTGMSQRGISSETEISRTFIRKIQHGGTASLVHHFSKDKEEIKKTFYHNHQPEWVFDLETGSSNFMAGVGNIIVANSPRRGETFVTRKITRGIARILKGLETYIYLGNLRAQRDWGFAPEYVESMWKMLQQPESDDFVVGTGEAHYVEEFVKEAFSYAGLDMQDHVKIDYNYFRPTEVDVLLANPAKAKEKLGWDPKIKFRELARIMIDADMRALGLTPPGEGDKILAEKFPNRWWNGDMIPSGLIASGQKDKIAMKEFPIAEQFYESGEDNLQ